MKPDRIYAESRQPLVDFTFDEGVADVFPDMIRRSVPGYGTVISTLGILASTYHQSGTRIYDLGCSLGAATLSVHRCVGDHGVRFVAVDNAPAMMERCRKMLHRLMPAADIEFQESDIRAVDVRDASVVVLNFTLQFLPVSDRKAVLKNILAGLKPGGILVLSEKVLGESPEEEQDFTKMHHRFKSENGYSELEISQKRTALENVLCTETVSTHQERLSRIGFSSVRVWFRCLNFVSILAVK